MAGQDRKKGNLKMALVLASIAAAFFIGFVAKMIFLGR
ncbi:MAG TPA: cytochrome oxidase small assembly protein [Ramlibacter sp.]|nr:cytochrome oxidase small assembly protein [Ramlibacter sp.]